MWLLPVFALLFCFLTVNLRAQNTTTDGKPPEDPSSKVQPPPKKKVRSRVKVFADLRLRGDRDLERGLVQRAEIDLNSSANSVLGTSGAKARVYDKKEERTRWRARLRFGFKGKLSRNLVVVGKLATGDSNKSRNQTLEGVEAENYNIRMDRAYFKYKRAGFKLLMGRIESPLYKGKVYSHLWDGDLAPEGVALRYAHNFNKTFSMGLVAGHYMLTNYEGYDDATLTTDVPFAGERSIDFSAAALTSFTLPDGTVVTLTNRSSHTTIPFNVGQVYAKAKFSAFKVEAAALSLQVNKRVREVADVSSHSLLQDPGGNIRPANIVMGFINLTYRPLNMGIVGEVWENLAISNSGGFHDEFYYDRTGRKGWRAGVWYGKLKRPLGRQMYFQYSYVGKNSLYKPVSWNGLLEESNMRGYTLGIKFKPLPQLLLHLRFMAVKLLVPTRKFVTLFVDSSNSLGISSSIHLANDLVDSSEFTASGVPAPILFNEADLGKERLWQSRLRFEAIFKF